jgi:serine/threonine-protein kinase RsbW
MPMTTEDEHHTTRAHLVVEANCVGGELAAIAASVPRLRGLVVDLARSHGADDHAVARIALAVTEAVTNAILHAYTDDRLTYKVQFAADIEPGSGDLQVVISDRGSGMRSDGRSAGLGQGLRLIASITNDFSITELEPHGLEVWMRFLFEPAHQ